jgi:hypothetical protein
MVFQITQEHLEQESLAFTKVGAWCYMSLNSKIWHIRQTEQEVQDIKTMLEKLSKT